MNNYPNFSDQGYQIIRELGHNNIGGRVTYLLDKLSSASSEEKRLMCFSRIGFYFSLGTIFFIFLQVRSQLHCFTLGEILVSVVGAIATLSITLIPLIYLILKPLKITYKYRKAEPNLIKA